MTKPKMKPGQHRRSYLSSSRQGTKRTAVKRGSAPVRRVKVKRVSAKRSAEVARTHGPKGFRPFVRTLPCAACRIRGLSENAHLMGNGGMGRKKAWTTVGPLCRSAWYMDGRGKMQSHIGCHWLYDVRPNQFAARFPAFDAAKVCADTHAAFLASRKAAA